MSTQLQLLSSPGKVHELCDDLESLWFVLLFESLHFLKHNKPIEIDLDTIFDYVSIMTGLHSGLGKRDMYSCSGPLMTKQLQFDSKPFTALVRQIYQLFESLCEHYRAQAHKETPRKPVKQDVKKLENCEAIKRLLEEALDSDEWQVSCDKAEDQY